MAKRERGLHELYAEDPHRADWAVFGRRPLGRRGFLRGSGLTAVAAAVGAPVVFAEHMPAGLIPAALANEPRPFRLEHKHAGLVVLNDRPINAETPAHLLDDGVTPTDRFFVRNNGLLPVDMDPGTWRLRIDGEATRRPTAFSITDLRKRFETHTYALTLECGGNGRSEFRPRAKGNQWTTGAVACARWTGVRLKDVLDSCGVTDEARYIGFYGADRHLSGDPKQVVISRGVPMAKALEDETLVAWAMNGTDIPAYHGAPLRLVVGGWPGSVSGKWLTRIAVRDRIHDGPKMGGASYRVPCKPVAPGETVPDRDMCIIESMPVKSLITSVESGRVHPSGRPLPVAGHAWAGDLGVARVDVSIDFGQTWQRAQLDRPPNRLAWQRWRTRLDFPGPGYYEIWARASDSTGRTQPLVVPGWNPKGYLNHACHRIAIRVHGA